MHEVLRLVDVRDFSTMGSCSSTVTKCKLKGCWSSAIAICEEEEEARALVDTCDGLLVIKLPDCVVQRRIFFKPQPAGFRHYMSNQFEFRTTTYISLSPTLDPEDVDGIMTLDSLGRVDLVTVCGPNSNLLDGHVLNVTQDGDVIAMGTKTGSGGRWLYVYRRPPPRQQDVGALAFTMTLKSRQAHWKDLVQLSPDEGTTITTSCCSHSQNLVLLMAIDEGQGRWIYGVDYSRLCQTEGRIKFCIKIGRPGVHHLSMASDSFVCLCHDWGHAKSTLYHYDSTDGRLLTTHQLPALKNQGHHPFVRLVVHDYAMLTLPLASSYPHFTNSVPVFDIIRFW
jgi:hypothetical protein